MKRSSSTLQPIFKVFILTSVILAFAYCNSGTKNIPDLESEFNLSKANWLLGSWQAKEDTGFSIETWERINDSMFKGISFYIKFGDTTIIERLSLKQQGDSLYYTAIVTGQNDGLPIKFAVIQMSDSNMIIQNPTHDFPKIITYNRKAEDSLIAVVSGIHEEKDLSIRIPMKKSR